MSLDVSGKLGEAQAARAAAKAPACVDTRSDGSGLDTTYADAIKAIADHGDQPLDIHDICSHRRACGFTDDLALTEWEAQAINTRLYGLSGNADFLPQIFEPGIWQQFGLCFFVGQRLSIGPEIHPKPVPYSPSYG